MKFATCLQVLVFLNNKAVVNFCGWWGWGGSRNCSFFVNVINGEPLLQIRYFNGVTFTKIIYFQKTLMEYFWIYVLIEGKVQNNFCLSHVNQVARFYIYCTVDIKKSCFLKVNFYECKCICFLWSFWQDQYIEIQVNESRNIALFVVSGSIKKLF